MTNNIVFLVTGGMKIKERTQAMHIFKKKWSFRWFIGSFICLSIMMSPAHGNAKSSASDVIKTFNATLLDCMKRAKELGFTGRYKLLEPVFRNSFASEYMVGTAAGKYWKTLSEKQQQRLFETYIEWSVATYAGRFDEYSGQSFRIVSESKPLRGTVTVLSKLAGSKETDFYYKLKKIEGRWQIVDIQISGVSQLALTRSQFVSVLGSKGFDGLISTLREKIANFSRGKETV